MDPKNSKLTAEHIEKSTPTELPSTESGRIESTAYLAMFGLVVGYIAATEISFMPASVLMTINDDLGPREYFYWLSLGVGISAISGWCIAGALSDQYGRRGIVVFGNVVALIGAIVCATSKSIWVLLLGSIIAGYGAGCQSQASAILSEMFKKKHRGIVQGLLFISPLPFLATGPLVGRAMAKYSTWRWVYYINIILTAISGIIVSMFYYPPPRQELESHMSMSNVLKALKAFDWIGTLLVNIFVAMMGLAIAWGGFGKYKWSSAAVLVPLIAAGVSIVCLAAWETYIPKNPLFPHTMFINTRGFLFVLLAVAMATFGIASIDSVWSTEISALYTTDPIKTGVYLLPSGFGEVGGALISGLLVRKLGHTQFQFSVYAFIMAIFIGLMATLTPKSIKPALAYTFIIELFGGALKLMTIVMVQLAFGDELIATATGVVNVARNIGPAFANAFYLTIIRSRVSATLAKRVAGAVLPLGLPMASLPALLMAIASQNQAALLKVPGITPTIIEMAILETQLTYAAAFRIVYYLGLATAVLGSILGLLCRDVTPLMTEHRTVDMGQPRRKFFGQKLKVSNDGIEEGNSDY